MSAGYILYSLDTDKFRRFVDRPTPAELAALGTLLASGLEEYESEFPDDPMARWPRDARALESVAAQRLALPDWYGDLSDSGKSVWESVVWGACANNRDFNLGFRVDNDGIYWDVISIAWKELGVTEGTINDVALSTFGTRPFRYHPELAPKTEPEDDDEAYGDLMFMHSMHTPDEVAKMLAELKSVEPAMKATRIKGAREDYESALASLEKIVRDGRMLFVQVDT